MTRPLAGSRANGAALVLAVTTGLGLFECLKGIIALRLRGEPTSWVEQLVQNMPWWYGWALLVPVVVLVPRHLPLDASRHRTRNATAHALAAVALASAHLWIAGAAFYLFTPGRTALRARFGIHTFWQFERTWHENFLVANVISAATIMGCYYALSYYRRYRETELGAVQMRHRASEAQLHALRMELNPHFLFNTLNAIAGLVRKGESGAAVTVLARLADLLRATLDRGVGAESSLGEELALLETYLDIERARFGDRLTVRVEAPNALHASRVPTFLLQPLVENAVRHGVARHPGPGTVDVRVWSAAERLLVEVRDTGPGLPPDGSMAEGVGLSNTRARLAELHGAAAGLSLANAPEGGAVARVWLPLRASSI